MANKKNITKATETKNIDELIPDTMLDDYAAETPTHRFDRPKSKQDAIRDEAGYEPARDKKPTIFFEDLFDEDEKVDKRFFGVPSVGIHEVKVDGAPEIFEGKKDIWINLSLIDTKTSCVWHCFVSRRDLNNTLDAISANNNGLLAGKPRKKALDLLRTKSFNCWTLQTEKGNTATYFDEEKFNKRLYIINRTQSNYELEKVRQKEREDDAARRAEEAKM